VSVVGASIAASVVAPSSFPLSFGGFAVGADEQATAINRPKSATA
jgi:hypothetical protein